MAFVTIAMKKIGALKIKALFIGQRSGPNGQARYNFRSQVKKLIVGRR